MLQGVVNLFATLPNPWPIWHTHLCETGKVTFQRI